MLHLAIIGIVCAVFTLNEGTAFIGRKNYESDIFCHMDEGEPNVAKVSSPVVYNVEVYSSDCTDQKITNRTSSFFYDFIIKQYKNNRSSSCSIMDNVAAKRNLRLNVGITYQKRNLLWSEKKLSPKTLRPPMENDLCEDTESKCTGCKNNQEEKSKAKKCKSKNKQKKITKTTKSGKKQKCDLSCKDKKMFFSLKNLKRKNRKKKSEKRQSNMNKLGDKSHLNKRIKKSVELGKKYSAFASKISADRKFNFSEKKSKLAFPFRRNNNLCRFSEDYLSNKNRYNQDALSSVVINNMRNKDKMASINNNIFKTMRKPARFRRNLDDSYSFTVSPVLPYRQKFIAQPYPYSANFKIRGFLYPQINRNFVSGKTLKKIHHTVRSGFEKPEKNYKNWPFYKKHSFENYEKRIKRFDKSESTDFSNDKSVQFSSTKNASETTSESNPFDHEEVQKKSEILSDCSARYSNPEEISTNEKDSYSACLPFSTPSSSTSSLYKLNAAHHDQSDVLPDHTLEKPFLEREMPENKVKSQVFNLNLKTSEPDYNPMTELPLHSSTAVQPYRKQKYELRNDELLNPDRFLKIRHALRNYLIRNNAWVPSKRIFPFDRKKRSGRRSCSTPHKCWRSAPLLCVPYIRKGQEDVLKFVIKFLQKMMGKPLPPKAEIFEKTKFKPYVEKEFDAATSEEDNDECESTTSSSVCLTTPQCCITTSSFNFATTITPKTSSTTCQTTTCATTNPTTCVTTNPTTCVTTNPTTCVTTNPTTCVTTNPTTCVTTNPTTCVTTNPTTCLTTNPTTCVTTNPTTCVTTNPTTSSTTTSTTHSTTTPTTYSTTTPTTHSTTTPTTYSTTTTTAYFNTFPTTHPTPYPTTWLTTTPTTCINTYPMCLPCSTSYSTFYSTFYSSSYSSTYATTYPNSYSTPIPPNCLPTYPSTLPTCPTTYPTPPKIPVTHKSSAPPRPPSVPSRPSRPPAPTASSPVMSRSLSPLTCPWTSSSKFSPVTYLPPTCPTPRPIYNNQKPYLCQTSAPSKECRYPDFNSCPSGFPFMVPHMEPIQGQPQNQINSDDKLTNPPPHLFSQYSTTSLYHVPFISTIPLSDSNFASNSPSPNPARNTQVNVSPNSYRTITRAQTKTDSTSTVQPTSTINMCSLYISSSPEGQEEFLSYTSIPYEKPSECATAPYDFSQTLQEKPFMQTTTYPDNYISNNPSRYNYEVNYGNSERRFPHFKNEFQWPPTTIPTTVEDTSEIQGTENSKDEKDIMSSEDFNDFNEGEKEKKLKSKLRKNLISFNQRKELRYNDYCMNDRQAHEPEFNLEKTYKRLFRLKHHKKTPKSSYKHFIKDVYPSYDDYGYEKYLLPKQDEGSTGEDAVPMPPNFWKKIKRLRTTTPADNLIRKKRENDYYFWPEKFDNYNDYADNDGQYNNENFERHQGVDKAPGEGCPDVNWTPPSYDMFSELAKAVTENNTTVLESVKNSDFESTTMTDSTPKNHSETLSQFTQSNNHSLTNNCANNTEPTVDHVSKEKNNCNISTSLSNYNHSTPKIKESSLCFTTSTTFTVRDLPQSNFTFASTSKAILKSSDCPTSTVKTTLQSSDRAKSTVRTTLQSSDCVTSTAKTITSQSSDCVTTTVKTILASNNRTKSTLRTTLQSSDCVTSTAKTITSQSSDCVTSTVKTTLQSSNCVTSTNKTTLQSSSCVTSSVKTTLQYNNSSTSTVKSILHCNCSSFTTTIKTTITPEETNTECCNQAVLSNSKSNGHDRVIDSKKSGKTSFFQTNSKAIQNGMENPGFLTTARNSKKDTEREDQELEAIQDLGNAEEILPTTLKTACIAKGPKKLLTKPSPKVYSKVYPDSLSFEFETNETLMTTTVATTRASVENRTALLSSTAAPDIRLQLLAVCEGYLEVVKLIKAQNQTIGEDLDADLARYCENIISQSFNCQQEKPKKSESVESTSPSAKSLMEVSENQSKNSSSSNATYAACGSAKEFSGAQFRDKIMVDILNNPAYRNVDKHKNKTINHEKTNSTEINSSDTDEKLNLETESKDEISDSDFLVRKEIQNQRKEESEAELLKKGMTQEQVELISLLKKRKKALLSWLLNSKEGKSEDSPETEYFEDEDLFVPDSDSVQDSGTIKPKRNEQSSGTTEKTFSYANESIFPVYAKQYGYDKGGELREVEVLWRKVNEKTHEEKILKNLSVLALLLTSTEPPKINSEETRLVGSNGYENEEMSEIELKSENKARFAGADLADNCDKTTTPLNNCTENSATTSAPNSTTTSVVNSTTKSKKKNATYTFITKPDPSSIVGAPPNVTKTHRNVTQKASHKLGVAKDIFQEYTIEFLNYAVYILPIMFTVLFLFCVVCCALHILKTKKSIKRLRKKKKKAISTDDSTETTEESEHESKKKRWGSRRKRKCKDNVDDENLEEKRSKKFWNVLKLPTKSSKDLNVDNQTENKKSFLRFLKSRRDEGKVEDTSAPLHELDEYSKTYPDSGECKTNESDESHGVRKKKKEDDKQKSDDPSEAAERRELIALLEELKKIETENTGEKKEVKSVHVQYVTQEDETPAFQKSNFSYPYQKNVFGMPENYSLYSKFPIQKTDPHLVRDYELYEDVNELTELLPCECNYYSKKNNYMRHCDLRINHEGRCERYLKIFRDSGVSRDKHFREKNFRKNESENRSFIFNKYKSISTDTSEELMGVTKNNAGTEVRFTDTASPFKLASKTNAIVVEELDNFKRQLNKKKYVRLKDDGVLCRL